MSDQQAKIQCPKCQSKKTALAKETAKRFTYHCAGCDKGFYVQKEGHKKTGRPETPYDPEYADKLITFFTIDEPYKKEVVSEIRSTSGKTGQNLFEKTEYKLVGCPIPFFGIFCVEIGITKNIFFKWVKEYDDFQYAYKVAKEKQKQLLVNNMLIGAYAASPSIFTAKNILKWRDKHDVTSDGKSLSFYDDEQILKALKRAAEKYNIAGDGKRPRTTGTGRPNNVQHTDAP